MLFAVYLLGLSALFMALVQSGAWVVFVGALPPGLSPHLLTFALVTLPLVAYHVLWESSPLAATPGKLAMGLRVRSADGGMLGAPGATARAVAKYLPLEVAHASFWYLGGFGTAGVVTSAGAGVDLAIGLAAAVLIVLLWIGALAMGACGRAGHDYLAGSRVERGRAARPRTDPGHRTFLRRPPLRAGGDPRSLDHVYRAARPARESSLIDLCR
jgi:uncharacterized RDD family membrane protein YckC